MAQPAAYAYVAAPHASPMRAAAGRGSFMTEQMGPARWARERFTWVALNSVIRAQKPLSGPGACPMQISQVARPPNQAQPGTTSTAGKEVRRRRSIGGDAAAGAQAHAASPSRGSCGGRASSTSGGVCWPEADSHGR